MLRGLKVRVTADLIDSIEPPQRHGAELEFGPEMAQYLCEGLPAAWDQLEGWFRSTAAQIASKAEDMK